MCERNLMGLILSMNKRTVHFNVFGMFVIDRIGSDMKCSLDIKEERTR